MKIRDPYDLISQVNLERFNSLKGVKTTPSPNNPENFTMSLKYVEPNGSGIPPSSNWSSFQAPDVAESSETNLIKSEKPINPAAEDNSLKGKIQRLGDYIDTDAVCSNPLTSGFNTHC